MRIVSGVLRGKKLESPEGEQTRPTADRARETLFNILNSMLLKNGKLWSEISFVDVFSGSGAVAIEAFSRGAKEVFCVENNPKTLTVLRQNIRELNRIHLIAGDALCPVAHQPVNIIFMDAPYGKGLWQKALTAFCQAGWIDEKTLIIIETDSKLKETLPDDYLLIKERSSGRNTFLFAQKKEF